MTQPPSEHVHAITEGLVLVADDSAVVRAIVGSQLTAHGWQVTEAANGVEALEACRRLLPEVILLDIEMPRMNGFEVLSALRGSAELDGISAIFLTKFNSAEDVAEGLRRGADDYLRKPFETPELVARLLLARRTAQLRDALRTRNDELERLAMTDALTDLPNRRAIQHNLEVAVSRAARYRRPLSVVLVDIDRFKRINDRHGHVTGDQVLQEVARRLRKRLRLGDECGRWGGEEFLVVLPDTPREPAAVVAEDVRVRIGGAPMGGARLDVTASLGVAEWGGETADELVQRADAALYAAKAAGRDIVR